MIPQKEPELDEVTPEDIGEMFAITSRGLGHQFPTADRARIEEQIRRGRYTFLFKPDGTFNRETFTKKEDL